MLPARCSILASERASFLAGETIEVNGGLGLF